MEKNTKDFERSKIDWMITLLPLGIILVLCILFFFLPEQLSQNLFSFSFPPVFVLSFLFSNR